MGPLLVPECYRGLQIVEAHPNFEPLSGNKIHNYKCEIVGNPLTPSPESFWVPCEIAYKSSATLSIPVVPVGASSPIGEAGVASLFSSKIEAASDAGDEEAAGASGGP